jgi:hypothetical protein
MIALNLLGKVALVTGGARGIIGGLPDPGGGRRQCGAYSDLAGYITGQSIFVDGGRTFCR